VFPACVSVHGRDFFISGALIGLWAKIVIRITPHGAARQGPTLWLCGMVWRWPDWSQTDGCLGGPGFSGQAPIVKPLRRGKPAPEGAPTDEQTPVPQPRFQVKVAHGKRSVAAGRSRRSLQTRGAPIQVRPQWKKAAPGRKPVSFFRQGQKDQGKDPKSRPKEGRTVPADWQGSRMELEWLKKVTAALIPGGFGGGKKFFGGPPPKSWSDHDNEKSAISPSVRAPGATQDPRCTTKPIPVPESTPWGSWPGSMRCIWRIQPPVTVDGSVFGPRRIARISP